MSNIRFEPNEIHIDDQFHMGRDGNTKKCQLTTNTNNQPRLAKKLSKNEHSSSLS